MARRLGEISASFEVNRLATATPTVTRGSSSVDSSVPCYPIVVDALVRIKRLVVRRAVRFTEKARLELEADALDPEDALEAILSSPAISKTIRSRSPTRRTARDTL
jgi:hypothetical protein